MPRINQQSTANCQPGEAPSGILVIDKPAGWTSHDVVAKVRRVFQTKKVGHAGTLDPMATGVLIILVGKTTKLSDKLLAQDKTYQAEITFGQQTDTADADGHIIKTADATHLTTEDVADALPQLLGQREQQVPAYSAVKVGGQKLYHLARQHRQLPTLPTRTIAIHQLSLDHFTPGSATTPPQATITITCSKGTYIRVLAEELAAKLQTVAHLTKLRRLASGQFSLNQAVTLDQLSNSTNPHQHLIDPIKLNIS